MVGGREPPHEHLKKNCCLGYNYRGLCYHVVGIIINHYKEPLIKQPLERRVRISMLQSPKQGGSQVITATWIPFLTATLIFRDVAMIFYTSGTKVTLFVVICEFTSGIFTPSSREWCLFPNVDICVWSFPSGTKTPTPYLALYDSLLPRKNHHCLPPTWENIFGSLFPSILCKSMFFLKKWG